MQSLYKQTETLVLGLQRTYNHGEFFSNISDETSSLKPSSGSFYVKEHIQSYFKKFICLKVQYYLIYFSLKMSHGDVSVHVSELNIILNIFVIFSSLVHVHITMGDFMNKSIVL